ncbi:hypothetical protein ACLOJK_022920 [Asimina triloba]
MVCHFSGTSLPMFASLIEQSIAAILEASTMPHLTSISFLLLTLIKMKNGGDMTELAADTGSREDQRRKWMKREMQNEDAKIEKGDAKQGGRRSVKEEGGKDEALTMLKRMTAAAKERRGREDPAAKGDKQQKENEERTRLRQPKGGDEQRPKTGERGRKRALQH